MTSTTPLSPAARRSTHCLPEAAGDPARLTAASSNPTAVEPEARRGPFAVVQLEFGFLLGPEDGRYLLRPGSEAPAERVIVLNTLGAAQRRFLTRRRRRRVAGQPEPASVPTSRVSVIGAQPFRDEDAAAKWLAGLRKDRDALTTELDGSVEVVNRVLRAHRAAVADPYVREIRKEHALARRVGYGAGTLVAEGRLESAVEVPDPGRRGGRAERLSPQERLAAVLGGRQSSLACEELLLRARLDVDSHRGREATLQARIALEALLAELGAEAAVNRMRGELDGDREALANASNRALDGELTEADLETAAAAVERMERVLARHRAGLG